jgi:hypothetical protein
MLDGFAPPGKKERGPLKTLNFLLCLVGLAWNINETGVCISKSSKGLSAEDAEDAEKIGLFQRQNDWRVVGPGGWQCLP